MADIQGPLLWGRSTATEAVLERLVEDRLLPPNPNSGVPVWISLQPEETEPNPPAGYVASLMRLHERGLCDNYGAELHNFSPNSISHAAVFVAVCEEYLGIEVHWDLWIHLFHGELFVENVRGQPKRFACTGGLMLHLRTS